MDVDELLRALDDELSFLVGPGRYEITDSRGAHRGNARIDLRRGEISWRLARSKGRTTIDLRYGDEREHPVYGTDILKRWQTGVRDDSAVILSDDVVAWLSDNIAIIENALADDPAGTIVEWEALRRARLKELLG